MQLIRLFDENKWRKEINSYSQFISTYLQRYELEGRKFRYLIASIRFYIDFKTLVVLVTFCLLFLNFLNKNDTTMETKCCTNIDFYGVLGTNSKLHDEN